MRPIHRPVAVVVAAVVMAASIAVGPVAAKECRTWGAQPPNVGSGDNWFDDVSLVSTCEGWAVGTYTDTGVMTDRTLAQRWNGTAWKVVSSPNVGGDNQLHGVSAVSSNVAWAVGESASGLGGVQQTLVLRWNGTSWTVKESPNAGGDDTQNVLEDVSALSGTRAYAVGYYDGGAGDWRTLIMRWNGTNWKRMLSPNVGDGNNVLHDVVALSTTNIWAVGEYFDLDANASKTLVLHWNGDAWHRVASPPAGSISTSLQSVAAVSATDVWAVGFRFGTTSNRTLILHWNGRAWKRIDSPNAGAFNNELYGVAATTRANAWAVGRVLDPAGSGSYLSLILRWDGSRWRVQPHPRLGTEDRFTSIAATSSTNAWAVGSHSAPARTLAMHCC
jgi:hypothetical protein